MIESSQSLTNAEGTPAPEADACNCAPQELRLLTGDPFSPPEDDPTPALIEPPKPRRRGKPVPGKGFRKSRRGCFNCKRRKVKCSESQPECLGCRRMGIICVYPPNILPKFHDKSISDGPKTVLNLDHLRFFHHFLAEAYPPHPFESSAVWHDVAKLSHEYEFLAHAILALSAQHLTLFKGADYSVQALDLRGSAIKGLNEALSYPCLTSADGDARYAAIMALTYQSSYMPDAMMDFLAMMRGWMLISTTLVPSQRTSLFRGFTRESFVSSMKRYVAQQADSEGKVMIEDFLASLRIVRSMCHGIGEIKYLSALEKLAQLVKTSPRDALLEMVPCYALTNKMTEDEYNSFTSPSNHIAQVLLAHFLMLDYVLDVHFLGSTGRYYAFCKKISQAWVTNIAAKLPETFHVYMMWPLGVARGILESRSLGE